MTKRTLLPSYGKLTVIREVEPRLMANGKHKDRRALCKCECGFEREYSVTTLVKSEKYNRGCYTCQCVLHKVKPGDTFGILTVIKRAQDRPSPQSGKNQRWYQCTCECGVIKEIPAASLYTGRTTSCGCLSAKRRKEVFPGHNKLTPEETIQKHYWRRYTYLSKYIVNDPRKIVTISFEEFLSLISQPCQYCGDIDTKIKKRAIGDVVYKANGLDRLNNSKGYTIDNVVPCCKKCNRAKNDMDVDIFLSWVKKVNDHISNNPLSTIHRPNSSLAETSL
jgi:5-methylcytosine-specific restriction endonuclease McrA